MRDPRNRDLGSEQIAEQVFARRAPPPDLSSYATTASVSALVVDSIADSDTTHAPSRNAVFDALALKQNASAFSAFGLSLTDDADDAAARLTMKLGAAAILGGVNAAMRMLPDATHPFVRGVQLSSGTTQVSRNMTGVVGGNGTKTSVNYGGVAYVNAATAASNAAAAANYFNSTDLVTSGGTINGYLIWIPFQLPDASYGSGATGCDIFIGANSSVHDTAVDTSVRIPTGVRAAGFSYSTTLGDTNWQFTVRDGTGANITTTDTGMAFAAQKHYVAFIHAPSGSGSTYWCLLNTTDGTVATGSTARQHGSTGARETTLIVTRTTVARSIRFNDCWTLLGGSI